MKDPNALTRDELVEIVRGLQDELFQVIEMSDGQPPLYSLDKEVSGADLVDAATRLLSLRGLCPSGSDEEECEPADPPERIAIVTVEGGCVTSVDGDIDRYVILDLDDLSDNGSDGAIDEETIALCEKYGVEVDTDGMLKVYHPDRLAIPAVANKRYSGLTLKESNVGGRVIGGDRGDLFFFGFHIEDQETVLAAPELRTTLHLEGDEINEVAREILMASFASIGAECVEHS